MYNCELTPVKDVPPQEKQGHHLGRTERSDAPEDLRKAINSFGKQSAMNVPTRPVTECASRSTLPPPMILDPRLRGDDVEMKRSPALLGLLLSCPLPPRLKRSVAGRARAVGCLTEPGIVCFPAAWRTARRPPSKAQGREALRGPRGSSGRPCPARDGTPPCPDMAFLQFTSSAYENEPTERDDITQSVNHS